STLGLKRRPVLDRNQRVLRLLIQKVRQLLNRGVVYPRHSEGFGQQRYPFREDIKFGRLILVLAVIRDRNETVRRRRRQQGTGTGKEVLQVQRIGQNVQGRIFVVAANPDRLLVLGVPNLP